MNTFKNDADMIIDLIEPLDKFLQTNSRLIVKGSSSKQETRAHQRKEMMCKCLMATLTKDARLQLRPYQNDYPFIKQVYASFLQKMVTLLKYWNIGDLASYMVTCKLDIEKFHQLMPMAR